MYYRNAAAAIVVYDITNEASFDILQEWIKELNRLGPADIVLAIAGNKCDLEDKREVRNNTVHQRFYDTPFSDWESLPRTLLFIHVRS